MTQPTIPPCSIPDPGKSRCGVRLTFSGEPPHIESCTSGIPSATAVYLAVKLPHQHQLQGHGNLLQGVPARDFQAIPIEEDRFGFEPEITVKVAKRRLRSRSRHQLLGPNLRRRKEDWLERWVRLPLVPAEIFDQGAALSPATVGCLGKFFSCCPPDWVGFQGGGLARPQSGRNCGACLPASACYVHFPRWLDFIPNLHLIGF